MKEPIFGGGLSPLNMERIEGGWNTKVCRKAHRCGLWRGINEGWERFSKHLALVVGNGSCILFWHDRWVGDTSLKMLYP